MAGRCPICLEVVSDVSEAYTNSCKHRFCFACILQWSEYETSKKKASSNSERKLAGVGCPLCKTLFTSIFHDFANGDFMHHYVEESDGRKFYQLSEAHKRRRAVYKRIGENNISCESQESEGTSFIASKKQQGKRLLEASEKEVNLEDLHQWVTRELQALMQEEDVELVVQHLLGTLDALNSPKRRKGEKHEGDVSTRSNDWPKFVADAVRPFVFEHAEKFALELRLFAHSKNRFNRFNEFNQFNQIRKATTRNGLPSECCQVVANRQMASKKKEPEVISRYWGDCSTGQEGEEGGEEVGEQYLFDDGEKGHYLSESLEQDW